MRRSVLDAAPALAACLTDQLTGWRALDPPAPAGLPVAHRAFAGELPLGRGRPHARVELEIGPWSEGTTELGLRPLGRVGWWSSGRRARYGAAAARLLDRLTATVEGELVRLADERRPPARLRRAS